jgi:hypothetical protein
LVFLGLCYFCYFLGLHGFSFRVAPKFLCQCTASYNVVVGESGRNGAEAAVPGRDVASTKRSSYGIVFLHSLLWIKHSHSIFPISASHG